MRSNYPIIFAYFPFPNAMCNLIHILYTTHQDASFMAVEVNVICLSKFPALFFKDSIFQSFSSSIVESTIGIPKKLLVNLTINRARVLIDIVYFCVTSLHRSIIFAFFFRVRATVIFPVSMTNTRTPKLVLV